MSDYYSVPCDWCGKSVQIHLDEQPEPGDILCNKCHDHLNDFFEGDETL